MLDLSYACICALYVSFAARAYASARVMMGMRMFCHTRLHVCCRAQLRMRVCASEHARVH
jgi:hypothetical protein